MATQGSCGRAGISAGSPAAAGARGGGRGRGQPRTHDAARRAVLVHQALQAQPLDQLAGQQRGRRVLLVGQPGESGAHCQGHSLWPAVPRCARRGAACFLWPRMGEALPQVTAGTAAPSLPPLRGCSDLPNAAGSVPRTPRQLPGHHIPAAAQKPKKPSYRFPLRPSPPASRAASQSYSKRGFPETSGWLRTRLRTLRASSIRARSPESRTKRSPCASLQWLRQALRERWPPGRSSRVTSNLSTRRRVRPGCASGSTSPARAVCGEGRGLAQEHP